jgi:hypothetical protein
MQISSISIRLEDTNRFYFEIDVQPTDTLHIPLGFQSLRVKVTNDWIKIVAKIFLTERAIALEEIVIRLLTYRRVDSKQFHK